MCFLIVYTDLTKPHCTLHNINWKSLLDGHRGPAKTTNELHKRQKEADILLSHVFGQSVEESVNSLATAPDIVIPINNDSSTSNSASNNSSTANPVIHKSTAELLELKEQCEITDRNWKYIVRFFRLGKGSSLYYVRIERQKPNGNMLPSKVCYYVMVRVNIPVDSWRKWA